MANKNINFKVTKKQALFISCKCDEVLFGGAAGGGKSYAQLIDSLQFALKYPFSKQLILRRTFPELARSLIAESLKLFPTQAARFLKSEKKWLFKNGSCVEFGYCDSESDVNKYQSAEYDVIRFDEVTHFTQYQYTYLLSRIRGTCPCPKQVKSTGNPGGVGHGFIKERFIDSSPPNTPIQKADGRSYIFIPSSVRDNHFLLNADPDYIKRLNQLPEHERAQLLDGDWDACEGQYYSEFSRQIHVIKPFEIPNYWERFISLDYGLDMAAALWWAVDEQGRAYIYRELYKPNLNLSSAANEILKRCPPNEKISYVVASPDLWNRRQETGYSGFQIMSEAGLDGLIKADDSRVSGWRALREWLTVFEDEQNIKRARLSFFEGCCPNIVRCLPLLMHSDINPEDCANSPHEITHAPDSLRYGIMSRPQKTVHTVKKPDPFGLYKKASSQNEPDISSFIKF